MSNSCSCEVIGSAATLPFERNTRKLAEGSRRFRKRCEWVDTRIDRFSDFSINRSRRTFCSRGSSASLCRCKELRSVSENQTHPASADFAVVCRAEPELQDDRFARVVRAGKNPVPIRYVELKVLLKRPNPRSRVQVSHGLNCRP